MIRSDAPLRRAIRCVLFDLDGTLIDSYRLYLETFRLALAPRLGRTLTDGEIMGHHPVSERQFFRSLVGDAAAPACSDDFLAHYRAHHKTLFDGPYPDIADMLADVKRLGLSLGVVTGKSRTAWDITSASLAFRTAFDVVVTDSDVTRHKPDPEGILAALAELGVAPRHALYVGDSLLDAEAARNGGLAFGAALWSKAPQERERFWAEARDRGALAPLNHPTDVTSLLQPQSTGRVL